MEKSDLVRMAMATGISESNLARVFVCFVGDKYKYRTLGGIARDSGVDKSHLSELITQGYLIRTEVDLGGEPVYTYSPNFD
jgi:hypothetical protein